MRSTHSDVSVVIPTFNRASLLERVLPSYVRQKHVAQVLVVDDASTDGTRATVQQMARKHPIVQYVRHPKNMGQAVAKNTGGHLSVANLIFVGEDDLDLDPDHLEVLVDHLHATGADVIAGRRIWLRLGETKAQGLARANRNHRPVVFPRLLEVNSHASPASDTEVPVLPATALVRREVFNRVQFSAEYRGGNAWREETDWQVSLLEKGYKLVFCPHTVSYHLPRASFQARPHGHRLLANLRTLYWMYWNNRHMLEKHRTYLANNDHLVGGSVTVTSAAYIAVRAVWMVKSEVYKLWRLAWSTRAATQDRTCSTLE